MKRRSVIQGENPPVLWQLCHGGWVVNTQTWSPLCIQSQHHINRETGTAMYRVSGKHSTKGMMETMLFAAVLKLRWVSLGKSVKSTCKPLNPGSRISLGVIFRQSYKLEKVRERLEKNFDDQNTSLLEHLTISHYLCYVNKDIFLYCCFFKTASKFIWSYTKWKYLFLLAKKKQ